VFVSLPLTEGAKMDRPSSKAQEDSLIEATLAGDDSAACALVDYLRDHGQGTLADELTPGGIMPADPRAVAVQLLMKRLDWPAVVDNVTQALKRIEKVLRAAVEGIAEIDWTAVATAVAANQVTGDARRRMASPLVAGRLPSRR
jgi:hypothetical protein